MRATPAHARFHDIYVVGVRLGPEGQLLGVQSAYNLTQTDLADETGLVGSGTRFAWTVPGRDRIYRVEYADLLGDELDESRSWPALARWQQNLTNLQHTGQLGGVARRSFRLDPAAHEAMRAKVASNMTACFELIENRMFEGPFVMGEAYSIADPYLFTIAGWLEADGVDPALFPKVLDHRNRMTARPAVARVLAAVKL